MYFLECLHSAYEETSKALSIVEKSAMTEGQLYAYERLWLAVTDERILREAAIKKGYNEGMEKGLEKGLEKGMKNAHIEDARKMKAKNYVSIRPSTGTNTYIIQ